MSRSFFKNFMAALIFLCAAVANAHDFEVNGIYYRITDSSNKTVEVTYKGDSYYAYKEYSGNVVIPASVAYNNVTYSVTSIGYRAFRDCSGLTSVTIPNSVTSIGNSAFEYCSGLTSVTIGNSVTSIGERAFEYCSELTSITIGNSVTSIGEYAFYSCSGLTSITIPNSVTSIENYAFSGCSGLTSITIPNSVTSIGYRAFGDCSGLTSITIPNSVTSIEEAAFSGCSGLTSIVVDENNTTYDSRDNCNAIIEKESNTLIAGCKKSIIPSSVTSIGGVAFYGCSGLTSITIPNSVISIGGYAFYGCSGLTSITIPNSVTSIGYSAFEDCSGLTSITIPNSVTSIEEAAFSGCSGLTSIVVDENNTTYDSRDNCNAIIEKESSTLIVGCKKSIIPSSVTSIGEYAFSHCPGLTSITIPNSVTSIGGRAFGDCSGLTSITIPNSVTSIGGNAFYGCEALNDVVLTQNAISIASSAFENTPWFKKFSYDDDGCLYINNILFDVSDINEGTSLKVKEGTVAIAGYALPFDNQIRTIEIPNSVKVIGTNAFKDCSRLTSIEIPNSVTSIGEYAFSYCPGLTSITIPNSVTSIGEYAFSHCPGLTSIKILNGVTRIGYGTFSGCTALKDVEIPNSVTSIGRYAFYNCSSLTSIEIPESVKVIEDDAFFGTSIEKVYITDLSAWCKMDYDCYVKMGDVYLNGEKIVHLVIPDDVKELNNRCFEGNTSIRSVKIGDNLESLGQFCFDGCNNINEIYIESKDYIEFNNVFAYNVMQNATVYVPKGQKDDYKYIFNPNNIVEVAHTLKYVIDGDVYKTESLGFGETISSINPIKEGHTFCGWEELPATMPNNDLTVNASFKVNQYTVTYLINGDIYKTETYDFGAAVLPIENLQRKGYTFSGWSQTLTTMPAMNVTIKSSLIANIYTIKYMVDGFTYATREYEYGELIQPLSDPFKNGYAFAGWSGLPERMPANDIVVTADFVKSDTAIDDVNSDAADVVIYDLNGNRITNPTTGVYIINGKKVFVK